jgi:hypothetical protein
LNPEPLAAEELERSLAPVVVRLTSDFARSVSQETIESCVRRNAEHFRASRISTYVPVFVERLSRQHLRELTREVS